MKQNTKYEVVALEMEIDPTKHDITREEVIALYNRLLEEKNKHQRQITRLMEENRELKESRNYWYKKATGADWNYNATDPIHWD